MKQEQFYKTDIKEQESQIGIDYFDKEATFYTSRKTIYNRMLKHLGEPTEIYYTNGRISGIAWRIKFRDKRINTIFSKSIIIGQL